MRRRATATLCVIAGVLGSAGLAAAVPQIFAPPTTTTQRKTDLFGVRFRAFGLPFEQDTQIFLGLPDLAGGGNTRGKYRWQTGAGVTVSHLFAFTWDPVNDKIITVIQPAARSLRRRRSAPRSATTVEFTGVRAKVAAKFPGFSVDDVNVVSFVLANRDAGSSALVNDIRFNGVLLGNVSATGFNTFNGIGIDFTQGFTLTGTLVLSGPFSTSRENSRVEILASVAECTANPDCDDGLACNGVETCNFDTLQCAAGTPVSCTAECDTGRCIDPDGICEQQPGCPTTTTTSTTSTSTTSTTLDPDPPPSTTTTSIPTSTTTTTAPPPDPCAGACGNGVLDTACGEVCDGADLGGAVCPADRPVGTPVCTAACRRIDYTPCMPAPRREICGNCFDDDGNGLTDFEDPACCPTTFANTITCSSLTPAGADTRLSIRSLFGLAPAQLPVDLLEVFIQLRRADGTELLCSRVPAGDFVSVPRGFEFRDPDGQVATARGIDQIVVRSQQSATRAGTFGQRAQFETPPPGELFVTVGLLSRPENPLGGSCSTTSAGFVAGRGGSLAFPTVSAGQSCQRPAGRRGSTCRSAGTSGGLVFPVVGR